MDLTRLTGKTLQQNTQDIRHAVLGDTAHLHVQVAVEGKQKSAIVTSKREVLDADDVIERGYTWPDSQVLFDNLYWRTEMLLEFVDGKWVLTTDIVFNHLWEHSAQFFYVDDAQRTSGISWTMATYLHHLFPRFGLLHLLGPIAVGKSSQLAWISNTAYNGRLYDGISPAALARVLDEVPGTIILDENEKVGNRATRPNEELAEILRSSFTYGSRRAICADSKKSWQAKPFLVSRPIAFGNIGGVTEDALGSRVIPIRMQRSSEFVARPLATSADCQDLREMLFAWSLTHWQQVEERYKEVCQRMQSLSDQGQKMSGRHVDAYAPLMTIASCISEDHFQAVLEQMKAKQSADEDQSALRNPDIPMLLVLRDMITRQGNSRVNNTALAQAVSKALNTRVTAQKTAWLVKMYQLCLQKTRPGNWATYDIDRNRLDAVLGELGAFAM